MLKSVLVLPNQLQGLYLLSSLTPPSPPNAEKFSVENTSTQAPAEIDSHVEKFSVENTCTDGR